MGPSFEYGEPGGNACAFFVQKDGNFLNVETGVWSDLKAATAFELKHEAVDIANQVGGKMKRMALPKK